MSIEQLLEALQLHNWYAVAAICLWILVALWKRFGAGLYARVPDGWRWLPPMLLAAATGFFTAWQDDKPFTTALLAAIGAIMAIAIPAMGLHSASKEAKQLKPPTGALLLGIVGGLIISLSGLVGCASGKPVLNTGDDAVRAICASVYSDLDGISIEEAFRTVCSEQDKWRPFYKPLLQIQKTAKEGKPLSSDQCSVDAGAP